MGKLLNNQTLLIIVFTHVVITFGAVVSDTWNLHAKSSCSKPRRDLIMISRNSCSNDNFFFGLFLLVGGRSFGHFGHTLVMIIYFRSSLPEVFHKKGVLRNFQNSRENTCAWVSFLIKVQAKGESLAQVFFCEFCEIS